ncbi:hypothetical protein MUP37_03090 [Candidatus Bathyarchaeota archaeon]|nr:hypothetical protein [Candidatus Bathyarchaeota archaeon]
MLCTATEEKTLSSFSNVPIPLFEIGGIWVPRLILGNLPFLGESYQGLETNNVYLERFSHLEYTTRLLERAIGRHNLTAISVMPPMNHLSNLFFQALTRAESNTGIEAGLIACFTIPLTIDSKPLDDYRRWTTYYHIEAKSDSGIAKKYLEDPILQCRQGWTEKFSEAIADPHPYDEHDIRRMSLDRGRLQENLDSLKGCKVLLVEPGSETDFLAMTGRLDILKEVVEYAKDSLGCSAIVGIHHAGTTIPILEEQRIGIEGYLTPVNKLGALMLPSMHQALEAVTSSKRPVVAIKTMAGGRITPAKAFHFVLEKAHVDALSIGVADEHELDIDVDEARNALSMG